MKKYEEMNRKERIADSDKVAVSSLQNELTKITKKRTLKFGEADLIEALARYILRKYGGKCVERKVQDEKLDV
jgi:hypothetical protein